MKRNMNKWMLVAALVLGLLPNFAFAKNVWDAHQEPSSSFSMVGKTTAAGLIGALCGFALGSVAQNSKTKPMCALVGALLAGALAHRYEASNKPEVWLQQFLTRFHELSIDNLLSDSNNSPSQWLVSTYGSSNLESLALSLKSKSTEIQKLKNVCDILLALGVAEFRVETVVDLKEYRQQLNGFEVLAKARYMWVSTIVDYEEFSKFYTKLSKVPVLSSASESWMLEGGRRVPFSVLKETLEDLSLSFARVEVLAKRLLTGERQALLSDEQRTSILGRYERLASRSVRCRQRLEYSAARADLDVFNQRFGACVNTPVLLLSGNVNDESWLMQNSSVRHLNDVARDLQSSLVDLEREVARSQGFLKSSSMRHFSSEEASEIASKALVLKDLVSLCRERQRVVRGLQKIESFGKEYTNVMAPRVVQEGLLGRSDLSWMNVDRNIQWPLEHVCTLLKDSKKELSKILERGLDVGRSLDVQALSDSRRNALMNQVSNLQRALVLVDQRLLFVTHSTMYADERNRKKALELEAQQRELREKQENIRHMEQQVKDQADRQRREREAVEQERVRLQQQRELDLVAVEQRARNQQQNYQDNLVHKVQLEKTVAVEPKTIAPKPSSPPVQNVPLESCFCGDEIPSGSMYKLDCSCKSSFYHRDCIKKWVQNSKTCPTCRLRVTLADIQRVGAFKPVAPEIPKPAPIALVNSLKTEQKTQVPLSSIPQKPVEQVSVQKPSVPQAPVAPVVVVEPDECYLCMDSDNVADSTTANCDCTVKKPACRACLQDWLARNHTCPNCRKSGATLVPYVK